MSSPLFRWLVTAPQPVGQLLQEHGLRSALTDGRVFVDGVRAASGATTLSVGAAVEGWAPVERGIAEGAEIVTTGAAELFGLEFGAGR